MTNPTDQETVGLVSGMDCGSRITASHEGIPRVELKASLRLPKSIRVAFVAFLNEGRSNLFFEEG